MRGQRMFGKERRSYGGTVSDIAYNMVVSCGIDIALYSDLAGKVANEAQN